MFNRGTCYRNAFSLSPTCNYKVSDTVSGPDFTKAALIPVIAQDFATGDVFMLAYMNEEAYLETKFGTVYLEYKNSVRRWL